MVVIFIFLIIFFFSVLFLIIFLVFLRGEGSASQVCPLVEKSLIQGTEEADAVKALRLIILQSLTSPGGLHPKVWNEYQRLLVQVS